MALAAAVAAPLALKGGHPEGVRALFAVLAGLALVTALLDDERAAIALLRAPAVVVLGALAFLSAVSALWTLGDPADAVRWALVVAGYGAVVVAAGVAARRPGGVAVLATGLAAIAAAAGAAGLIAAALYAEPWAERIYGQWQPGGPFEYPPALAMLQLAALPALLAGMTGGRAAVAAAAAGAGALAAEVVALTTSRFALASAALLALAALAGARRSARRATAGALALLLAAGVLAELLAGDRVRAGAQPDQAARLLALAGIAAVCAGVWWAVRTRLPPAPVSGAPRKALPAVAAIAGLLLAVALGAGSGAAFSASERGGFTHGRVAIWQETVATWLDRPLHGAGADAFLTASGAHQDGALVRYAHNLPLEAAAELGVLGLVLAVALYLAAGHALWRARETQAAWLLGPAVVLFPVFNLVDWTWHLAGAGAVWAAALGGCLGAAVPRSQTAAQRGSRPVRLAVPGAGEAERRDAG